MSDALVTVNAMLHTISVRSAEVSIGAKAGVVQNSSFKGKKNSQNGRKSVFDFGEKGRASILAFSKGVSTIAKDVLRYSRARIHSRRVLHLSTMHLYNCRT